MCRKRGSRGGARTRRERGGKEEGGGGGEGKDGRDGGGRGEGLHLAGQPPLESVREEDGLARVGRKAASQEKRAHSLREDGGILGRRVW